MNAKVFKHTTTATERLYTRACTLFEFGLSMENSQECCFLGGKADEGDKDPCTPLASPESEALELLLPPLSGISSVTPVTPLFRMLKKCMYV
mmetsp:Transcript_44843/g.88511  ORF Transcript_44843/g.88511 Transcript_44843/m.88511 type:complete len:92 (+) Transcript_44843:2-277(+)